MVVDPTVGSDRKGICIRTRDYLFVGPDNGVLWPAASDNIVKQIIHINQTQYFLPDISATFHGRDIFSPVCAHISKGISHLGLLGPVLETCQEYDFPKIDHKQNHSVLSVLNIDRFGNIALNLKADQFKKMVDDRPFVMRLRNHAIKTVRSTYAAAQEDELFLVDASHGYMEICLKNASAAALIQPSFDDTIDLQINP